MWNVAHRHRHRQGLDAAQIGCAEIAGAVWENLPLNCGGGSPRQRRPGNRSYQDKVLKGEEPLNKEIVRRQLRFCRRLRLALREPTTNRAMLVRTRTIDAGFRLEVFLDSRATWCAAIAAGALVAAVRARQEARCPRVDDSAQPVRAARSYDHNQAVGDQQKKRDWLGEVPKHGSFVGFVVERQQLSRKRRDELSP